MNIRLQAKELLYLSARLGAETFFGLADAFADEDETQIRQDIFKVESDLLAKGYAEMDFDGKITVQAEILRMVNACALCQSYCTVWTESGGSMTPVTLYYAREQLLVELAHTPDDGLTLRQIDAQTMHKSILEALHLQMEQPDLKASILLLTDDIAAVHSEKGNERQTILELQALGCSEEIAPILGTVLCGGGTASSLQTVDFRDEQEPVKGFTVLQAGGKALLVEQTETETGVPAAKITCVGMDDIGKAIAVSMPRAEVK